MKTDAPTIEDFINSWPLYQRFSFELQGLDTVRSQWPTKISRACTHAVCRSVGTTTWELSPFPPEQVIAGDWLLSYVCVRCTNKRLYCWVGVSEQDVRKTTRKVTIRKLGQSPPWDIEPARELSRALEEEDLALYKKALICMSQSFGLGALVYLRRVVENTTNALLERIEMLAQAQNDTATLQAIGEARRKRNASDKLSIVARALPPTLALSGRNPLGDLYEEYSVGIHVLTDDECADVALRLRTTFDYLFSHLAPMIERAEAYREAMAKRGTKTPE